MQELIFTSSSSTDEISDEHGSPVSGDTDRLCDKTSHSRWDLISQKLTIAAVSSWFAFEFVIKSKIHILIKWNFSSHRNLNEVYDLEELLWSLHRTYSLSFKMKTVWTFFAALPFSFIVLICHAFTFFFEKASKIDTTT